MMMLRTVAAYIGFVTLGTLWATSIGLLLNEFIHPSSYTNYVGFWSFASGLFGTSFALVARRIFQH